MLMLTMGGLGKSCPNVKFDHKRTIKEPKKRGRHEGILHTQRDGHHKTGASKMQSAYN